jgi:hypothetical protein
VRGRAWSAWCDAGLAQGARRCALRTSHGCVQQADVPRCCQWTLVVWLCLQSHVCMLGHRSKIASSTLECVLRRTHGEATDTCIGAFMIRRRTGHAAECARAPCVRPSQNISLPTSAGSGPALELPAAATASPSLQLTQRGVPVDPAHLHVLHPTPPPTRVATAEARASINAMRTPTAIVDVQYPKSAFLRAT